MSDYQKEIDRLFFNPPDQRPKSSGFIELGQLDFGKFLWFFATL